MCAKRNAPARNPAGERGGVIRAGGGESTEGRVSPLRQSAILVAAFLAAILLWLFVDHKSPPVKFLADLGTVVAAVAAAISAQASLANLREFRKQREDELLPIIRLDVVANTYKLAFSMWPHLAEYSYFQTGSQLPAGGPHFLELRNLGGGPAIDLHIRFSAVSDRAYPAIPPFYADVPTSLGNMAVELDRQNWRQFDPKGEAWLRISGPQGQVITPCSASTTLFVPDCGSQRDRLVQIPTDIICYLFLQNLALAESPMTAVMERWRSTSLKVEVTYTSQLGRSLIQVLDFQVVGTVDPHPQVPPPPGMPLPLTFHYSLKPLPTHSSASP